MIDGIYQVLWLLGEIAPWSIAGVALWIGRKQRCNCPNCKGAE